MSQFIPTRASSPSKLTNLAVSSTHSFSTEISRTSGVEVPELIGLTQDEVELLDTVIQRAGHSATTFLTVFKAYNDVLNERGLDPHEVLYYGRLLKLGTLKGRNWGDKWTMVKKQYGYQGNRGHTGTHAPAQIFRQPQPLSNVPKSAFRRVDPPFISPHRRDDSFTLHSHEDESESSADQDIDTNLPQYHQTPKFISRQMEYVSTSETICDVDDDIENHPLLVAPLAARATPPIRQRGRIWDGETSSVTEDWAPSITPPSYRAAIHDPRLPKRLPQNSYLPTNAKASSQPPVGDFSSATARKVVSLARERRGNVVNEDEAWNKIKMQRDEKEADEFRTDRILERCWEVWKQGFRWIVTTNQQIGEARDILLVRLSFQRWRSACSSRNELYQRVAGLSGNRCLRTAMAIWKTKAKEREQSKWRNGMRLKMKAVRQKRELKLRKDAWAKWRQSYCSHLSSQHYTERLVLRFYYHWKEQLSALDEREATAELFFRAAEYKGAERCWNHWKKASVMRITERVMAERIGLRLMGGVVNIWKKNAQDRHIAKAFYCLHLMKNTTRSWKTSRDRIQNMENRAVKHISRQDGVLLRAVARVWKARERGRLLERVKTARLQKETWVAWKKRLRHRRDDEELAVSFSIRSNANTVATAFHSWHQVYTTHLNAHSFAMEYHSAQLRYRMLLYWRIQLRDKMKLVKVARMANKFFAARRAWRTWGGALNARVRQKRLKEFETRRLGQIFHGWLHRMEKEKQRRVTEQTIQGRVSKRILISALALWTNRVIEVKLREIEVAQRHDSAVQALAFKKWKGVLVHHLGELSLMESYQFVKREENMRRMFYRWLAVARATRHRRITLQEKENSIKYNLVSSAWNKWRERFSDERLRPIEYDVIVQSQRNLLFRAFGIWHSKTKSLPAIRFHANHAKSKFFEMWRQAMPRALQAKKAREKDREAVLSKCMDRWVQTHRTKMALKAVARARYLRLPTAAPRQAAAAPRVTPATPSTGGMFPRRTTENTVEDNDTRPSWALPPILSFGTKTGISGLLRARPRSGTSPPRNLPGLKLRETSPARSRSSFSDRLVRDLSPTRSTPAPPSSVGGEGRSKLWLELREVQRKSKPSSLHSRTTEPP